MSSSLREQADRCLRELGAARGLDLSLDGNGMVSITFENGRMITFEAPASSSRLYVHAQIGRLPVDPAEAALRALELNLFRIQDPLAWIAYDAETSGLVLCAALAEDDISADGLEQFAAGFLAILEQVDARALSPDAGAPAASEALPEPTEEIFMIRG